VTTAVGVPVALLGYATVGSAVHRLLEDGADGIERATGHRTTRKGYFEHRVRSLAACPRGAHA